jgi:hypothetical protein
MLDSYIYEQIYAPQTKILEGGTKDEMRIFEALFKGVSTQFGPRTVDKCFSAFHLLFLLPKSSFGRGKITNPAWAFRGNAVSHIAVRPTLQNFRLGGVGGGVQLLWGET